MRLVIGDRWIRINTRSVQLPAYKYLLRWANAQSLARSIPDDGRFDMRKWGVKVPVSVAPCQTAACLAGHCGMNPWFLEAGLAPMEIEISSLGDHLAFEDFAFFGLLDEEGGIEGRVWLGTPFDPEFCEAVFCTPLTPQVVADVVEEYMRFHWDEYDVKFAKASACAKYNLEELSIPWNRPRSEESPISSAVLDDQGYHN